MTAHPLPGPAAEVLNRVAALPADWPCSGSLWPQVLERLAHHAAARPVACSAETGTGKSTLLLSHLSARHLVFTRDDAGDGDSLANVRAAPLLRRETTEFVVGPTQRTLPGYRFAQPLDVVLLDGPHGYPFPQLEYYFVHPHLAPGALLVLDDIHLRSVNDLFRFLRREVVFELLEVVRTTAFFRRTAAATLDPLGDGWWLQRYNLGVFPPLAGLPLAETLKSLLPWSIRMRLQRGGRRHR